MSGAGIQCVYFGNTRKNNDTPQKQVTAKILPFKVSNFSIVFDTNAVRCNLEDKGKNQYYRGETHFEV